MSELKSVNAKSPKLGKETTSYVTAPETVEEAIEMFSGPVVLSNALANWMVTCQAGIRRMHTAGKTDEEINTAMGEAKMGMATSGGRVDPIQASLAKFKLMDADGQAAYLEQLREAAESAE